MSFLSKLFKNVPKENFRIPMSDFDVVDAYNVDGATYEIYSHKYTNIKLVVDLDTMQVVEMMVARRTYY